MGELERTIKMLELVSELGVSIADPKRTPDQHLLDAARYKVLRWSDRPIDLAFLRAALGPTWDLLDSTSTSFDTKPSHALAGVATQAARTGWLGDVGRFDIQGADQMIRSGGARECRSRPA
jgi:hypothetical protein